MLREIIVVEGKNDIIAVKKAIDCDCIATHGHGFGESFLEELLLIEERRGLIIFTDPDYAGKKIRSKIRNFIPMAKHAYLSQEKANFKNDIGIENAKSIDIIQAIEKARPELINYPLTFNQQDLLEYGLIGSESSKLRRERLGEALGIGYYNGKKLLEKLNAYLITREEFEEGMRKVNEER